ncbi:hypothetical protein Poli38472_006572 [Pythium oligandrum]|uniref:Kinesin motor domain-containing protein n=1 Tax=Pythium oligandrum TaxID=41045 RepID=A0A8K1C5R2_PYTOL|nr:hypothetical protein Poli38472_006572 [Pythium oligandrum]|eukprot:TMW56562.1 hypothetical protein Poli38472_006572 [Pythium oligandrum]
MAAPRLSVSASSAAVVLGQLHTSCFITAANRATPVFEVHPDRQCIRVVNKPTVVHQPSSTAHDLTAAIPTSPSIAESRQPPTAEWEFHTVFRASPASHSRDFYQELTQEALNDALDGINSNVIVTGVHPTQKFRLLFGKSTTTLSSTSSTAGLEEMLEVHGQLGGLLHAFFQSDPRDWHLGISSWIIVNNQVVDLLKQPLPVAPPATSGAFSASASTSSVTFVSLEAKTRSNALEILHTAKTNRIVMKHTADQSHFFVRLAFFHQGQLSTLHFVDIGDLKEFHDAPSSQEKQEFYDVLHEIRQLASPTHASSLVRSPPTSPRGSKDNPADANKRSMKLSHFLHPLLSSNSKTFLYSNVIDSRTSLRENVALLNAVANVKGFACICKRLQGINYVQLGFQTLPERTSETRSTEASSPPAALESAAAKAMAAVAIGESLLSRLTSASSRSPLTTTEVTRVESPTLERPIHPTQQVSPSVNTDTLSWLETYKQRKQDILSSDPEHPEHSVTKPSIGQQASFLPLHDSMDEPHTETPAPPLRTAREGSSSSDLYSRLMATIQNAPPAASPSIAPLLPPLSTARATVRRSSSLPLPIEDPQDDSEVPCSIPSARPPQSTTSNLLWKQEAPPLARRQSENALEKAHLPQQVMKSPNLDGLDPVTASKVQAADAALLRKNYDALLTVVREQQQHRESAETRAADAIHECEELRAQYELQIENLKLDSVALKSKVRTLEKQSGCAQVFDQYEHEISRLHVEAQQLRTQNVQLELRLASVDGNNNNAAFMTPGLGGPGSLTELKKRYQAMAEDREQLERQLLEYRKKERQFYAQSRLVNESTRKADRLARELSEKEDALASTRLGKKRLDAEMHHCQSEAQQLQQENERLLMEKAATAEELLAAKMYLASVENEQKKAEILDRFVRKHGDRMQRLRGASSPSLVDTAAWRRDSEAKEGEDKLLQCLKRGLPQQVPLANKMIRKLEIQELSLREYAEREVDFINLLVELVSDQPAVALKTMIEEEMDKLCRM